MSHNERAYCPHCLSEVDEMASVCPHCTRTMSPNLVANPPGYRELQQLHPDDRSYCPHCLSQVNEFASACPHCTRSMTPSTPNFYRSSSGNDDFDLFKALIKLGGWAFAFMLIACNAVDYFHLFYATDWALTAMGIGSIVLALVFFRWLPPRV